MEEDKMKQWIDELSEQELIHVFRAAERAGTEAACSLDKEDAAHFVRSHIVRKSKTRKIAWTSASLLTIAAGLAALFFTLRPAQPQPTGLVADGENGIETAEPDVFSPADTLPATKEIQAPKRTAAVVDKPVLQKGIKEKSLALEAETKAFSPIKPDKDEYRIRVVNEDKSFVFRWDPSPLSSLELTLQDEKGELIGKYQFTDEDHFDFPARTGLQFRSVHWRMNVQYKDGAEGTKCGILYFDSVKE